MNLRLKLLRDELEKNNLTGMIVTNKINILYITGIYYPGYLLITDSECIYYINEEFFDEANEKLNIYSETTTQKLEENLNALENIFSFEDYIAIESESITLKTFDDFKKIFKTRFKPTENIIEKIREIKEDEEIEKIQDTSLQLTRIFENIEYLIKPHISELEIQSEIIKEIEKRNLELVSLKVASGENTANEFYKVGYRRINKDDILIIDLTIKKDEYLSTMARTFFIGDFKEKYKDAYENYKKIYKIQDNMLKILKKYNNFSEIYQQIKNELADINWNTKYNMGCGIGLEKEEEPIFDISNYSNVRKNMVITIKPQIYFKQEYGLVLKDVIAITDANFIFLTKYSKRDLEEILF